MGDRVMARQGVEGEANEGIVTRLDEVAGKMARIPEFKEYIARSGIESLRESYGGSDESFSKQVDRFIEGKINAMSDNIVNGPALNNKFYDRWLSDTKMDSDDVGKFLKQYRSLTDTTRFAVATGYIASHGNTEQEKDYSQNLHEENGSGKGKAHIELLDDFAKSLMNLTEGKKVNFNPKIADKSEEFESTDKAKKYQEDLYTGVTANPKGIKDSMLRGDHPKFTKETIEAVTAAHEGKAPGMLMILLAGSAKYIQGSTHPEKQKQISKFRKYFDDHLGEELVDDIIDGTIGAADLKKKISEENDHVRNMTSDECREKGYVEQAHRKDANKSLVETITSHKSNEDKMVAFVKAQESFDLFLKVQGQFWDGVAEGLDGKVKTTAESDAAEKAKVSDERSRRKSDPDFLKAFLKRVLGRNGGDADKENQIANLRKRSASLGDEPDDGNVGSKKRADGNLISDVSVAMNDIEPMQRSRQEALRKDWQDRVKNSNSNESKSTAIRVVC